MGTIISHCPNPPSVPLSPKHLPTHVEYAKKMYNKTKEARRKVWESLQGPRGQSRTVPIDYAKQAHLLAEATRVYFEKLAAHYPLEIEVWTLYSRFQHLIHNDEGAEECQRRIAYIELDDATPMRTRTGSHASRRVPQEAPAFQAARRRSQSVQAAQAAAGPSTRQAQSAQGTRRASHGVQLPRLLIVAESPRSAEDAQVPSLERTDTPRPLAHIDSPRFLRADSPRASRSDAGDCEATQEDLTREYAPYEFLCPITLAIMRNPVTAPDGFTYEETAITEWLQKHSRSPLTNLDMKTKVLVPNDELQVQIQQFLAAH